MLMHTSPLNFIGEYFLENTNICDDLISVFKSNTLSRPGTLTGPSGSVVDTSKKDSTDLIINDVYQYPELKIYLEELQTVTDQYKSQFKFCDFYAPWGITSSINIQHYAPGQGYHAWHTERGGPETDINTRHLAWMTYLNDVEDAGETEFYYQNKKVKPKKGLTLIWPADWTYTHRGITSPTEEKYIITGWYNYINY